MSDTSTSDTGTSRNEIGWFDGARAAAPIVTAIIPFGLVFGVAVSTADIGTTAAWASSFIIFAGASQIALVEIMGSGGAPVVAVITAVIINARMLLYSADVGRFTVNEPMRVKVPIAYLLTDQVYLVTSLRFPTPTESGDYVKYYLSAGALLWSTWQLSTTTGVLLGTAIPTSWSLEFAVPLTFMALLVLAVNERHGLVAAIVGGLVAVTALSLPYNLGLIVGAASGIAAGMISERLSS